MNFTQSISSSLSQYAEFDGRSSRAEFLYFNLFVAVFVGTFYFFGEMKGAGGGIAMAILSSLALLLPYITTTVRRFHDTGRSGWWFLVSLLPIVGLLPLVFLLAPGEQRMNHYGI